MEHFPFDIYGQPIPHIANQNGEKARRVWVVHAIAVLACKVVEIGKQRVMGANSLKTSCELKEALHT